MKNNLRILLIFILFTGCWETEERPKNVPKEAIISEHTGNYMLLEDDFGIWHRTVWDKKGVLVSKTITKNRMDRCIIYFKSDGSIDFAEERKIGEVEGNLVDDCSHF